MAISGKVVDLIGDGGRWFAEVNEQWPGQAMCIQLEETLFEGSSDFQKIEIHKTKKYGRMMTIDGCIQSTERDEFAYHEMMAHVPLYCHLNPQDICIIGGGDGGVLREVIRHQCVKSAVLCDIDGVVVEQSRVHLPHLAAAAAADPRTRVLVGDGARFLDDKEGAYDVIIVDSSDPDGPAGSLFGEEFYRKVARALRPGGVVCSQGECVWLHLDLIHSMVGCCRRVFGGVAYGVTSVPTYPSGQIGLLVSGKDAGFSPDGPARRPPPAVQDVLRYYSPDVHSAAFVLPEFARRRLAAPAPSASAPTP